MKILNCSAYPNLPTHSSTRMPLIYSFKKIALCEKFKPVQKVSSRNHPSISSHSLGKSFSSSMAGPTTYRFVYGLLLILFLMSGHVAFGQKIEFVLNDESKLQFNLKTIQKISFTKDSLVLELKDSTRYSKKIGDISFYRYTDSSAPVSRTAYLTNPWELKLSPNPVKELVQIQFYLPYSNSLTYSLADRSGRQLQSGSWGYLKQGIQIQQITLQDIPPGVYILNIYGKNEIVSKPIIKN